MRIIGGQLKGRRLHPPRQPGVRPTTDFAREGLFNLLEQRMEIPGLRALDLFCGTGAISFELASRGAGAITCADKNGQLLSFIRQCANELGLPVRTIRVDVFKWIKKNRGTFDLIFADPPYHIDHHEDIPKFVVASELLAPGGWLVLEHPEGMDFSSNPYFESHRIFGAVHFSFFKHQPQ